MFIKVMKTNVSYNCGLRTDTSNSGYSDEDLTCTFFAVLKSNSTLLLMIYPIIINYSLHYEINILVWHIYKCKCL